jgi:glutamate racemase
MKAIHINKPIGVFDSGIGGLTVVAAIKRILPSEKIIYFGDLLHLPYGSKSSKAVLDFSRAAVSFLIRQDIKLLVIACNTATSIAMPQIKDEVDIPVIGVISPGVLAACKISKNRRIGVIGTTRTIESDAYKRALTESDKGISVFQKATPLLVPLIEEGWIEHPVMQLVLTEYLNFFHETEIDTIVLGCTHYPLIREAIQKMLPSLNVVDSAETTAVLVKETLKNRGSFEEDTNETGGCSIYLTDFTENFRIMGERIIGKEIDTTKLIKLNYSETSIKYST